MANVDTNPILTNSLLRPSKLDTFSDFYNRLMEQQKSAEALYGMTGYKPAFETDYESKAKKSYGGSTIGIGVPRK